MTLRTRMSTTGMALVAALGMAVAASSPAGAVTRHVYRCATTVSPCIARIVTTTSTVRGTVDKAGVSTATVTWKLTSLRGLVVCSGKYRPVDPPKAWVCRGVPIGPVIFTTPGTPGPTTVTATV
jgi:hypothetical protein